MTLIRDTSKGANTRLLMGRRDGYTMQAFTGNMRKFRKMPFDKMNIRNFDFPEPGMQPLPFGNIPGPESLSASTGPDGVVDIGAYEWEPPPPGTILTVR